MSIIKVRVRKVHKLDRELFPEGTETYIVKNLITGKWLIKSNVNGKRYTVKSLTERISNTCSFGDILTKI